MTRWGLAGLPSHLPGSEGVCALLEIPIPPPSQDSPILAGAIGGGAASLA